MKKVLILVTLFISQVCMANTVTTTKITSILVGEVYGNVAFIGISENPQTTGCQDNPDYNYVFDTATEVGKATLAMAMMAYASNKDVYLDGYHNDCSLFPSAKVERLRQLMVK